MTVINFNIEGDVVGRDNIKTGDADNAVVNEIVAAKLRAKLEEAKREAEEDANGSGVSSVVQITGVTVKIGGRVVSGDLTEKK